MNVLSCMLRCSDLNVFLAYHLHLETPTSRKLSFYFTKNLKIGHIPFNGTSAICISIFDGKYDGDSRYVKQPQAVFALCNTPYVSIKDRTVPLSIILWWSLRIPQVSLNFSRLFSLPLTTASALVILWSGEIMLTKALCSRLYASKLLSQCKTDRQ